MQAIKTIIVELISAVVCGLVIGLLMAITASAFVQAATFANDYRSNLSWMEFNLGESTYSFSSVVSLLLAAALIAWIKKWLNIQHWAGPADSIYAAHSENAVIDTRKGIGSTAAAFIVISSGGSVGQYGPLVHFGSTIGLFLKKYFTLFISKKTVVQKH